MLKELSYDELYEEGLIDSFLQKAQDACKKKLRGRQVAGMETDDVVQEVLIKVYKSLDKYDARKARMSTFIDHVIEMKIIDCLEKAGTGKNLMLVNATPIMESYGADNFEMDDSMDSIQVGEVDIGYEYMEIITDLMTNLGLTEQEKVVFKLRSAGYEFAEIATYMQLSKARISQLWGGIKKKYKNC